ncbi:hypothetical protein ILUMI_10479 [Ignelater luminosus]|uniref:Uncharacterized protein n=1 Tax=Ignelater luminosus TaxID=2038154 RepID=A0A8K0D0D4_IGNLU|nr:hypothetical protein ILUMI_10479 [Ignelater luminosus]
MFYVFFFTTRLLLNVFIYSIKTPEINDLPISCISMRNAQIVRYNETPVYESRVPYNSPVILDVLACRYEDIIHFGLENIKSYLQFDNEYIKNSTNTLMSLKKTI